MMNREQPKWGKTFPRELLAERALDLQFQQFPNLSAQYSTYQKQKALEDMNYHLRFLEAACEGRSPEIFSNYLIWLKDLLLRLGVPVSDLKQSVLCVNDVLKKDTPELITKELEDAIAAGIRALEEPQPAFQSFLTEDRPFHDLAIRYLGLLLAGKRHEACDLILFEVENGMSVKDVYLHVFQPSQYEIGYLWHQGRITVAQEHFCTAACQYIIARLYPSLFQSSRRGPKVVAACIGNELHEMGIRMVADFLELSGFDTYYLGANTPAEGVMQTIKQQKPAVLALSTTIAYHMGELISLIDKIRDDASCKNVKILVGGYPFNMDAKLWKKVGADGFAQDAAGAATLTMEMAGGI